MQQLPFHPIDDFTPLTRAIESPLVMVVNADLPIDRKAKLQR